jgi:hypothetical protein
MTFLIHSGHLAVDLPGRLPLQMQEPYHSVRIPFVKGAQRKMNQAHTSYVTVRPVFHEPSVGLIED